MIRRDQIIVYIFRGLWIILALALVFYVVSRNIFTERSLLYNLDFKRELSRDINGWYPSSRTDFILEKNALQVNGEPIYLKAYLPVDFRTLTVRGSATIGGAGARLGIKQNNEWFYKDLPNGDFTLSYGLDQAKLKRRSLEMILSAPDLTATSTVLLDNNWQLYFER